MLGMLGAGRGGSVAARLLAVQLAVKRLDPLATVTPSARSVATVAAKSGAHRAEDEEEEQEREEEGEETESEAPMRVAVIRDRRGAGGGQRGRETLRQADLVRDETDGQREDGESQDPETVHVRDPFRLRVLREGSRRSVKWL